MTTMVPAVYLIGHPNAKNILATLGDGFQFIPGVIQTIPMQDEVKLSSYNRISLDTDLNDKNLQEEIKKLEITKDKTIDLTNLQSLYQKFSANSFSYNRNQSKRQTISGVGIDGSGLHPIDATKEERAINLIETIASDHGKWNAMPEDGDEILKESVKNICFWQACNISQLPIGTPVEVCSAVIELLSPIQNTMSASTNVEFKDTMTGREFIDRRREITGLRYFLDGNVPDIENKNKIIKGIRDFENQRFIRFGRNGTINDRGAVASPSYEIYLVTDVDIKASRMIKTGPIGTPPTLKDGVVKFQLDYSATYSAADYKLINKDLRDDYLNAVISDAPITSKKEIRGVLLFLFTIFFEYACYIFNLYEEKLISKLDKKTSSELIQQLRKANNMMIGNFILLINYSLIRKFHIKDANGQYFNAQGFISVQQVENKNANLPLSTDKTLTTVIKRIHSDKILHPKGKEKLIRVFFEIDEMYEDTFQIDENQFKPDNFPLVFDTNKLLEPIVSGIATAETFLDVSYRQSIQRLTEFLLQGNNGVIPTITHKESKEEIVIAVGAPMQNDDFFQETFEALASYYTYIKSSKQIYITFAELKIEIFRSGFPSDTIRKWYMDNLSKFNIIFTTHKFPQKQQIELLKMIGSILNEYKKYRKQELKYLAGKSSYNKNGNRMANLSREKYNGLVSVRAGLAAEMIYTIAKLSYEIFESRMVPKISSPFITDLDNQKDIFDAEIQVEASKIMQKQKLQINSKLGKGSLQIGLIGPGNIPQPPAQFLQMFSGILQPGSMISSMGSPSAFGSAGKIPLSLENRLKVENLQFWQDLRTIFNGRTLFLPVVKLNNKNNFDDSEFYLINILSSMIFNKLSAIQISENGVISRRAIDSRLLNNGYILLSANTVDLSNPNSWRCVNYKNISKLKKSNGMFKDIKKIRGLFFNIIANTLTLTEILNVSIPSGSNTSNGLVKYCSNVLKKDLPNCNILISRQQFAKTVQNKMNTLKGTAGIDLMSGTAYFEHGPYAQLRNSNIIVR
jgi:hypothetical protein